MKKLKIDPEFKNLIPPLSDEEYKQLRENLIEEGCRDSLVAWNETILDGHNRYEICTEYNIPFSVDEMDFETRDEALEWMIKNQFGRRNLPNVVRVRLALKLEDVIKEKARKNMELSEGRGKKGSQLVGNLNPIHTNAELGKIAGVSDETIRRYKKIQEEAKPEIKEKVDKGEMSIRKGYSSIKEVFEPLTKTCTVCGKEKPRGDFYAGRTSECKECKAERGRLGVTITQAKELNKLVSDEVLEGFYNEMKTPSPTAIGNEASRNNNSIIAELDETLKQMKINLNPYTFIPDSETHSSTKENILSLIQDLEKINSKLKEK